MNFIEKLKKFLNSPEMKPVWEATKEALRLIIFSLISAGISYLNNGSVDPELAVIGVVVLRAIDKVMHEYGKDNRKPVLEKGLTRF